MKGYYPLFSIPYKREKVMPTWNLQRTNYYFSHRHFQFVSFKMKLINFKRKVKSVWYKQHNTISCVGTYCAPPDLAHAHCNHFSTLYTVEDKKQLKMPHCTLRLTTDIIESKDLCVCVCVCVKRHREIFWKGLLCWMSHLSAPSFLQLLMVEDRKQLNISSFTKNWFNEK